MSKANRGNLVITRTDNQKIYIGEDVVITIAKARNNKVQVLIKAPREVKILRGELVDRDSQPLTTEA